MSIPRVLVVENDESIANLLTDILEYEGYAVEHSSTPGRAYRMLATQKHSPFNLVISNCFCNPRVAPFLWLDRLRLSTSAPIMICTTYLESFFPCYTARGFEACVSMPFTLNDFVDLVARLSYARPLAVAGGRLALANP